LNTIDWLERFAGRRIALAAVGLWSAAEAIALPIVPDVGVCLLALAAPRRTAQLLAAVVVGAMLGSAGLAAVAAASPEAVRSMLLSLPAIDALMLADVDASVSDAGLVAFAQVGPGPPLKVYTAAWVGQGGDLVGPMVGAILNRITRIGPVVLVAAIAGMVLGRWIRQHDRLTVLAYGTAWVVFYAVYFG